MNGKNQEAYVTVKALKTMLKMVPNNIILYTESHTTLRLGEKLRALPMRYGVDDSSLALHPLEVIPASCTESIDGGHDFREKVC